MRNTPIRYKIWDSLKSMANLVKTIKFKLTIPRVKIKLNTSVTFILEKLDGDSLNKLDNNVLNLVK